jgi:hypothetical protein
MLLACLSTGQGDVGVCSIELTIRVLCIILCIILTYAFKTIRPEPTKWAVVVILCARPRTVKMRCVRPKSASRPRAPSLTMTAHFVGSGRLQAVSPCGEHVLHVPDVRSDIRSRPWRRCSHLCSHPGTGPCITNQHPSTRVPPPPGALLLIEISWLISLRFKRE